MGELMAGQELAGYRIVSTVGRGGMGVVYRAEQTALDRMVALKVIAPELADREGFRERFQRECRIAASLRHPNVIAVYDAREVDGTLFVAMEYIEGTDLREAIAREGRLPPDRAVAIIDAVAAALDAAHSRGLVHRDVKPGNVLIGMGAEAGRIYLTDFGLSKATESQSGLTATGMLVGTVDYIAPEQVEGGRVDQRLDVYALGCVLYELLTGAIPFPRDTELAKLYAHVHAPRPRVSALRPELAAFDPVIQTALAVSPDQRYGSAAQLAEAARDALHGPATRVVPRPPVPPRSAVTAPLPAPDPTQERPRPVAPRTGRRQRRRVAPAVLAGAAVLVAGAGVAGWAASGGGDGGGATARSARAGILRLPYDAAWRPVGATGVPGMSWRRPLGLAYTAAGDTRLVAGVVSNPAPGRDALPADLRRRLAPGLGTGTVRAGGRTWLAYSGVSRDGEQRLRVFMLPTDRGYVGLVCASPAGVPIGFDTACEREVASAGLAGAAPQPLGPVASVARALQSAGRHVAAARTAAVRGLRAGRPATRARAAMQLAAVERRAAASLAALRPPAQEQADIAALARGLRAQSAALAGLAAAARARARGAYARGLRRVERTENSLAFVRRALDADGYRLV